MAAGDGGDEVRVLQNLRGKIYDAKHLVPNKMRDFFCTINLDQEEVFRTQVVEKSLSPYFGEEFYFEIPRTFQWLSFYIYDKSVLQKDLRIGKVSIKKDDLCNYTGKENWFMLQPVDSNSEVQGKVHLELKLNELITDNGSVCQQLVVQNSLLGYLRLGDCLLSLKRQVETSDLQRHSVRLTAFSCDSSLRSQHE